MSLQAMVGGSVAAGDGVAAGDCTMDFERFVCGFESVESCLTVGMTCDVVPTISSI